MSVDWQTPPKRYEDLVQVTDGYVVHARGYTLDDTVWLDEYALYDDHYQLWHDEVIASDDRLPQADPDDLGENIESFADDLDHDLCYWSVTGSGTVTIRHPRWDDGLSDDARRVVRTTLDALMVPPDTTVRFLSADGENLSDTTARDLRS